MNALPRDYRAQEAEDFVRTQLGPGRSGVGHQLVEGFRMWRPDNQPAAMVPRPSVPLLGTLVEASTATRYLRRRVEVYSGVDPGDAFVSGRLAQPQPVVDRQGGFDQPHSVVRIRATDERAFGRFWGQVGQALDHPKGATSEEVGLTVVSGMEFGLIRGALAKVHGMDQKPRRPHYQPMFPIRHGGTAV
jgi:hypothetical protein